MKPFGKLSPNDKLSSSLMPMLFDRPHKVLEKLRTAQQGIEIAETVDSKVEERMAMGLYLEEHIIALTAKRLALKITYPIEEVMSMEIGTNEQGQPLDIYASLDGLLYANKESVILPQDRKIYTPNNAPVTLLGPVPVEVKNMQHKPYENIERLTQEYGRGYLQNQSQCMIAEAKYGIISILFNGNDLRTFVCSSDSDVQKDILEKSLTLYKHLDEGTDYTPQDLEAMASKFPVARVPETKINTEVLETVKDYEELVIQRKELDQQIDHLQMQLVDAVGDAQLGVIHHNGGVTQLSSPVRHYKAQPAKYVEAKEARDVRSKTVAIKHLMDEWN